MKCGITKVYQMCMARWYVDFDYLNYRLPWQQGSSCEYLLLRPFLESNLSEAFKPYVCPLKIRRVGIDLSPTTVCPSIASVNTNTSFLFLSVLAFCFVFCLADIKTELGKMSFVSFS
jgi:hypothetical protein